MVLLPGLLWMDLALVGAILAFLTLRLRSTPIRWGWAYLLLVESYLLHWLVFSLGSELPPAMQVTLGLTVLIMPWTFWIFALYVFEDGFRPGAFHIAVLIAKAALAFVSYRGRPGYKLLSAGMNTDDLLRLLPNVVFSFALIFHVMLIAWRGRETDLIEMRIDLRRVFALLMGVLIVWFMVSFLVLLPLGFGQPVQIIDALLLGLLALAFISNGLQLRPGLFPELEATEQIALPLPADRELETAVLRAFEGDHVYRSESFTIGQLARHVNAQEYRVRRVINRQMGFRNFNDLLNRYRVQEACELLAQGTMPIIRIATEVGYPSPAPFNRAFRQITGMTPTQYRKTRE